jgi:hypothetical protein
MENEIKKENLDPRIVKDLEKRIEKMEGFAETYYGFFRMGGAINMSVYKSMGDVEKAGCLAARKRIREEEAKFTMKCMMAVFDTCLARLMDHSQKNQEDGKASAGPEEAAVGKAMDAMEDKREIKVNAADGSPLGSMVGDQA